MADNNRAVRVPAVLLIDEFDTALATSGASAATRRQRRWALTEAVRFAADATGRTPDQVDVATLLRTDVVAGWLASAASGDTHSRGPHREASRASLRARRASVRAIADHLQLPTPDVPVPTASTAERLTTAQARAAVRSLLGGPPPRMQRSTWARTAVLAALVVDTGERTGALTGLAVDAIDQQAGTVDLGTHTVPLHRDTTAVLHAWLHERSTLVHSLEGSPPPQLWVTTRTVRTGRGETARLHHAGLPLTERALHLSHQRCLRRLVLAGAHVDLLRLGQYRPEQKISRPGPD
ncbi:hypothetical protein [Haloactinopolyspora alba]|uniref:hypothetical protein n=1 Tax=Haloactinopolyspora alba TaxID=648780 RepID=UPI000D0CBA7B|nr:hypothetical protein [Haloactinopolyspora alba]